MVLVGGDLDALRSGAGAALRRSIANLTGVPNATAFITGAAASRTELNASALAYNSSLAGGGNGTASNGTLAGNATDLAGNATAGANGTDAGGGGFNTTEVVLGEDDPLNAPLAARRRLQASSPLPPAPAGCNPVNITFTTVVETVFLTVELEVRLPVGFLLGDGTASAADSASGNVTSRMRQVMGNATALRAGLDSFITLWSACTGLPPSLGLIAAVTVPAATVRPNPRATEAPSAPSGGGGAPALLLSPGAIIGVSLGASFIAACLLGLSVVCGLVPPPCACVARALMKRLPVTFDGTTVVVDATRYTRLRDLAAAVLKRAHGRRAAASAAAVDTCTFTLGAASVSLARDPRATVRDLGLMLREDAKAGVVMTLGLWAEEPSPLPRLASSTEATV